MSESYVLKAGKIVIEQGSKAFRWMRVFPPGVWIIVAVLALVGGRIFWLNSQRPKHLKEIAAAYGSISLLDRPAQFDHDLTRFTYVATTETRGVGVFICDIATRQKRLVVVQKDGGGYWHDEFDLRVGPWSPDDKQFLYSMNGRLFVQPVDTNSPPIELALQNNARAENIVWINGEQFAWLEGQTICAAAKTPDNTWNVRRFPHEGPVSNLAAIDDRTIAWLQEDYICRLDLSQALASTNDPFAEMRSGSYATPVTNGLALWLDASGLPLSNGVPVRLLADLSPRKNPAVVNHDPPVFNDTNSPAALNGKGTIHFQSGTSLLFSTGMRTKRPLGITGAQPRSVFAVMRRDNKRRMLLGLGTPDVAFDYFGLCDQSDLLYVPAVWSGKGDSKFKARPPRWNLLEAAYDGTNQDSYLNGSLLATKPLSLQTSNSPIEIGLRTRGATLSKAEASDGDLAELLIYDRALSVTERRQVEDYLNSKWFGTRPLSPSCSFVWLDPKLDGIKSFDYSRETGKILITRSENGRDSLWRLDPKTVSKEPIQILEGRFLHDAQWTGLGAFAYASREAGHRGILLANSSGKQSDALFPKGDIGWFKVTPDQKNMIFWGNVSNEPAAGIWQYDLYSGQLHSIISGSEQPSPYAKSIASFDGFIRLSSGRDINCRIYPPASFNRNKKYPLVIGDTLISDPIHGEWLQSGIAAAGAYVVFVKRPSWYGEIKNWEENVRAIYDYVKHDPCIDTDRVYLFGASAETRYMSECLVRTPGFWKGAIFLNPSMLPNFTELPRFQNRPKIFISAGSEEQGEERFKRFREEALQSGVLVECVIHPTETHRMVGMAGKLARLVALKHFIFEE